MTHHHHHVDYIKKVQPQKAGKSHMSQKNVTPQKSSKMTHHSGLGTPHTHTVLEMNARYNTVINPICTLLWRSCVGVPLCVSVCV